MSDQFDKDIENALKHNTKITTEEKNEIWNHVNKELFSDSTNQTRRRHKKVKKSKRWIPWVSTIAAAAVLWIGLQTDSGYAVIDKIKTMFAPEKEITQQLEGNDEETKVDIVEGTTKTEYIIYIDESRYKFVKGEEFDQIVPKVPLEERYPEVSMTIFEITDQMPEDVIKEYERNLQEKGLETSVPEQVSEPLAGWKVRGIEGSEWNSIIERYYVISNGKNGSFVFKQNFFLEAEEGHGARFHHMMKEFQIVSE